MSTREQTKELIIQHHNVKTQIEHLRISSSSVQRKANANNKKQKYDTTTSKKKNTAKARLEKNTANNWYRTKRRESNISTGERQEARTRDETEKEYDEDKEEQLILNPAATIDTESSSDYGFYDNDVNKGKEGTE